MSLLTQAFILERYGPRLNAEQLAQVLGITVAALHTQRSKGSLEVPCYLDAGKLWADYRDVAGYFDRVRERAREAA
jgi:hypothetical protein